MAVEHKPTAVVHRGTKGSKTGCGTDTREHSSHWVSTGKSITCGKNGCS